MRTFVLITILIAFSLYSCKQVSSYPLMGAWELVKGEYKNSDTTINYPLSSSSKHLKILTEKHFTTIWQDTTDVASFYPGFNGGTYTLVDSIYTENFDYNSDILSIGKTFTAKIKIEDDRFFITPSSENWKDESGWAIYEEWKKIE